MLLEISFIVCVPYAYGIVHRVRIAFGYARKQCLPQGPYRRVKSPKKQKCKLCT